jgi:hypothetical protein
MSIKNIKFQRNWYSRALIVLGMYLNYKKTNNLIKKQTTQKLKGCAKRLKHGTNDGVWFVRQRKRLQNHVYLV